jgi:hypothetical protein
LGWAFPKLQIVLGPSAMVLALMSKRENMVNIGHGIMELELMSKWIIQYGSIQVTDGGINKTGFMFQQKYIVHS